MKINFIYLRSKIESDPRLNLKQREEFLSKLNKNNDFEFTKEGKDIFFIETGGAEEAFKNIYLKYKEPYIIFSINANNSLPASLEIVSFLRKNNKKYILLYGEVDDLIFGLKNISKAKEYNHLKINSINKNFLKKRYGVIGKPSDWLISSDVNYLDIENKIGTKLIDISFNEFKEEINKAKEIIHEDVFKKYLNEKIDSKTLKGALKIYSALRSLIIKYDLNGLCVRCFDLLSEYKNTSCLALALLNQDGYVATCEGDVPAMLTMAFIKEYFHQSSFQVNPSYINLEKRFIYFAHCTLPLDMTLSYSFDTHFESNLGVAIKGRLNLGNVTVLKINSSFSEFEAFEGKITANLQRKDYCRTQIKVEFSENIDPILYNPIGNHLIITYGHKKDEILSILK